MRTEGWRRRTLLAAGGAALVAGRALAQPARTLVQGGNGLWTIADPARASHAKVAPFLGREALWLRSNTHAIRQDVSLTDGEIAFDMAPMDQGDFFAVVFRRHSFEDHENLYFRLSRSGEFMALQYAPRIQGSSTWQLYPEFLRTALWPRNAWTRVRILVSGSKLDVFLGGAETPLLSVPRLRHTVEGSEVAFWARVNDRPEEWAAALSNLTITPAAPAARDAPLPPPPGFISRWEVTGPFPADSPPPAGAVWTAVAAEESGLVNLTRLWPSRPGQRQTAWARATLICDTARMVRLGVGYSDDVTVLLNGAPVYSGINGWESRYPRFASFVDTRFERAWLPLKAGANSLVFAVTDDQRFGWGLAAHLDPADGVRSG